MPPRGRRPSAGKGKAAQLEEEYHEVKIKEEPIIDVRFGEDDEDSNVPENIGDMLMGSDSSDSDSEGEDEPQVTVHAPASSAPVGVPTYSYFEVRADRDKRAYVECFADILGRVKTNHHFRCKGCGQSIIGQYLSMLVHMAGTRNHLSVRCKACPMPIPAVRARILQDFEDYNAKEKVAMALIKSEPGQPSLLDLQKRGRKRTLDDILEIRSAISSGRKPLPPARRSVSLTAGYLAAVAPAHAAVYENAIRSRHAAGGKAVSTADVSEYYSTVLTKSADLKTSCCTTAGAPPLYLRQALCNIHTDVMAKYYGCGFIAPDLLQGLHVLDLGCGAGRDCYVLSQLVGEHGRVVGVDMSETQLATARATQEWHRQRFGYRQSNVEFIQAHLETLLDPAGARANGERSAATTGGAAPVRAESAAAHPLRAAASLGEERDGTASVLIKDEPMDSDSDSDGQEELTGVFRSDEGLEEEENRHEASASVPMYRAWQQKAGSGLQRESFHVIVSNCVLNLSPDKAAVLNNAYELLRPGGELYFSDVYCTQRVPLALRQDPVLWGECLSGALYWNDFLRLARECGFGDPRLVSSAPIAVQNAELEERIAQHMPSVPGRDGEKAPQFYSATYRLFKIAELEPDCEDYGQAVMYLGTMPAPAVSTAVNAAAAPARDASSLLSSPLPLHSSAAPAHAAGEGYDDLDLSLGGSPSPGPVSNGTASVATANGNSSSASSAAKLLPMFSLDDHHHFPEGRVVSVCGNTFRMLNQTRFRPHFQFIGEDFSRHFGIFDGCGKSMPFATGAAGGGCC